MIKELLKEILLEQRDALLKKELGVERTMLKEITKKITLPFVHVITGIRRCGKSTFLRQIIHRYFNDSNFYYINFEDERLFNFKAEAFNQLYEALLELYGEAKTFFIDEIQNVDGFESFVRRFTDDGFKFFITGSNAGLLSNEISTKLTGRHIDTYLQPFSFEEFLRFQGYSFHPLNVYKTAERAMIKKYFADFLKRGGMPEYIKYHDPEILFRTYKDILIKDIAIRYKLHNIIPLKELSQYLITNFGRKVSFNTLKNILHFGSVETVMNYFRYLETSFLTGRITRFDHSLKKQLMNRKKIYVIDNGFISNVSLSLPKDTGRLLENLVFNALDTNANIYYYSNKSECDFVSIDNKDNITLIQVTQELHENNIKRERTGLEDAMRFFDNHEGMILTYDTESEIKTDAGTITVTPVWKYLLRFV